MTHESFAVWSCYTKLTFNKARSMEDADVVVMFTETTHDYYSTDKNLMVAGGDGSSFDGKSGELASLILRQSEALRFIIPKNQYQLATKQNTM